MPKRWKRYNQLKSYVLTTIREMGSQIHEGGFVNFVIGGWPALNFLCDNFVCGRDLWITATARHPAGRASLLRERRKAGRPG